MKTSRAKRNIGRIEHRTEAAGVLTPNWETFAADVRLAIEAMKRQEGDEQARGKRIEANPRYLIKMRYRAGVTHAMRIVVEHGMYAGRIFNLRAIRPRDDGTQASELVIEAAE